MGEPRRVKPETEAKARAYALVRIQRSLNRRDSARAVPAAPDSEQRINIDMTGILGEMAVANVLGVKYEFTVDTFNTVPDIVLPNGLQFEVKATSLTKGPLVVRTDSAYKDRIYVLVDINWQRRSKPWIDTRMVGWIPGDELQAIMNAHPEYKHKTKGERPEWKIPRDYLKPPDTLEPMV